MSESSKANTLPKSKKSKTKDSVSPQVDEKRNRSSRTKSPYGLGAPINGPYRPPPPMAPYGYPPPPPMMPMDPRFDPNFYNQQYKRGPQRTPSPYLEPLETPYGAYVSPSRRPRSVEFEEPPVGKEELVQEIPEKKKKSKGLKKLANSFKKAKKKQLEPEPFYVDGGNDRPSFESSLENSNERQKVQLTGNNLYNIPDEDEVSDEEEPETTDFSAQVYASPGVDPETLSLSSVAPLVSIPAGNNLTARPVGILKDGSATQVGNADDPEKVSLNSVQKEVKPDPLIVVPVVVENEPQRKRPSKTKRITPAVKPEEVPVPVVPVAVVADPVFTDRDVLTASFDDLPDQYVSNLPRRASVDVLFAEDSVNISENKSILMGDDHLPSTPAPIESNEELNSDDAMSMGTARFSAKSPDESYKTRIANLLPEGRREAALSAARSTAAVIFTSILMCLVITCFACHPGLNKTGVSGEYLKSLGVYQEILAVAKIVYCVVGSISAAILGMLYGQCESRNLICFGSMWVGCCTIGLGLSYFFLTSTALVVAVIILSIAESIGAAAVIPITLATCFQETMLRRTSESDVSYFNMSVIVTVFGIGLFAGSVLSNTLGYANSALLFAVPYWALGGAMLLFAFMSLPFLRLPDGANTFIVDLPSNRHRSFFTNGTSVCMILILIIGSGAITFNCIIAWSRLGDESDNDVIVGIIFVLAVVLFIGGSMVFPQLLNRLKLGMVVMSAIMAIIAFLVLGPMEFLPYELDKLPINAAGLLLLSLVCGIEIIPVPKALFECAKYYGDQPSVSTIRIVSLITASSLFLGLLLGTGVGIIIVHLFGYGWMCLVFVALEIFVLIIGTLAWKLPSCMDCNFGSCSCCQISGRSDRYFETSAMDLTPLTTPRSSFRKSRNPMTRFLQLGKPKSEGKIYTDSDRNGKGYGAIDTGL